MIEVDIGVGATQLVRECAALGPEERVLVVTDTQSFRYGVAILTAAMPLARQASLCLIRTYGRLHGQEPPDAVAEAMRGADVLFLPTEHSLSHTRALRLARDQGARVLTLPQPDDEIFARTLVETPFALVEPVVVAVNALLGKASEARLTAPGGTDLRFDLRGRVNQDLETGYCRRDHPNRFAGPPDIEANVAPIEEATDGILVCDASSSAVGLVDEPIEMTVKRGRVVDIRGGRAARTLRERLAQADDPHAYVVAELGIGLNPAARVRGRFLEDEAAYGTAHVGTGNNRNLLGGAIDARVHFDHIMWRPTLTLDGDTILRDGRLTLSDLPAVFR